MSKNNIFDKEEIEKLRLDMAGSFFIDLIGQNMPAFVKILQKIVIPPTPLLVEGLSKLYVENITLERKFDNALIPRARPRENENITEVHWLFVVQSEDSKTKKAKDIDIHDYIVYNPYDKHRQIDGSQQFCQSHALYMAYKYYSGDPSVVTNPRDAFVDLLGLFKLLITHMPTLLKSKKNIAKVLRPIFKMNKETEKNQKLINHVIARFPKDIHGIYNIMNTDKAKLECPTWR
jgi:hypothetical protein